MRILKLKGKTEKNILSQIEKEYGDRAVVLSTQKEEQTGLSKWFKPARIVITIAVKDDDEILNSQQIPQEQNPIQMKQQVEEASYEVLLNLKDQLNELKQEIGDLKYKKESQYSVEEKQEETNTQTSKLIECMKEKLLQLGVRGELCESIFKEINDDSPEGLIRHIYTCLEEELKEKQNEDLSQIIFFIGSTGVGKTTTLAKLTAKLVLEEQKRVVLFTSDTYRIAAVEQLKTYADILGVEIEVIYNENELPSYIEKWKHMDHILIDTAGRSHKNEEQVKELKALIQPIKGKQVFLVLNASTAAKDAKKIVQTYEQAEAEFDLIITKLDETDEIGNVVNISHYAQKPIMYLTNGQNVPADIQVFSREAYIMDLLGRIRNE